RLLFDELRTNHLLILGCGFGDWLARFFLRTARSLELSQRRKRWDVLVGEQLAGDASLMQFLESFSPDARVIRMAPGQFVAELVERWQASHPAMAQGPAPAAREAGAGRGGAIFVSYAREDLAAASRLTGGLRTVDLEVWFDQDALQVGDNW